MMTRSHRLAKRVEDNLSRSSIEIFQRGVVCKLNSKLNRIIRQRRFTYSIVLIFLAAA